MGGELEFKCEFKWQQCSGSVLSVSTTQPKQENLRMNHDILYVGIDISKLKHDVAVMNEHKQLLGKTWVIREDRSGYLYLSQRLEQLREKHHPKLFYVGMEATADYWKNLFHFLRTQPDCQLVVINPLKTHAFAKTELRRAKTDPVDARDIAQYLVEKKPQASYFRPPFLENIKDMNTQIQSLKKQQTMTANRLRIELGKVAPEIEQQFRYIQGKQIMAIFSHFPTAKMIEQASLEQLCQISYGLKQRRIPEAFVLKVQNWARNSIGFKSGEGAGSVVQSQIRTLQFYQTEIEILKEQTKQLYQIANSNQADILATIKGVTKESAIILDAYFGDIHRFKNSNEFVAFFGMNPTLSSSGKSKNRKSRLQKKGDSFVRYQLFLIALNLIRTQQEPFYTYYQRLQDAGKPKLVALCAVMRKLLVTMFMMLKNNEIFDSQKN